MKEDRIDAMSYYFMTSAGEHPPAAAPQPGKRAPGIEGIKAALSNISPLSPVNIQIKEYTPGPEVLAAIKFCLWHMKEEHQELARRQFERAFKKNFF